jgi:hypothetical protein
VHEIQGEMLPNCTPIAEVRLTPVKRQMPTSRLTCLRRRPADEDRDSAILRIADTRSGRNQQRRVAEALDRNRLGRPETLYQFDGHRVGATHLAIVAISGRIRSLALGQRVVTTVGVAKSATNASSGILGSEE